MANVSNEVRMFLVPNLQRKLQHVPNIETGTLGKEKQMFLVLYVR